jgi:hypothetical protein
MVETIIGETKREGQRNAKGCTARKNQKRRELVPFVVGNYFTHSPFNVTYIQIMRYNSNGRSRISITC